MSDRAEDDLIALVAQEQRGFRRVLFAGFGILFSARSYVRCSGSLLLRRFAAPHGYISSFDRNIRAARA
jgi:hypothetical protein